MAGAEDEQPVGQEQSETSTDYARLLADAKAESAGDQDSGIPSQEEVSAILGSGKMADMIDGMSQENQRSLSILESGTNNTGVGNKEFARSQLLASLYSTRERMVAAKMHTDAGEGLNAEIAEQGMAEALRESHMWEKVLRDEPLTAEEENLVRGRALSIRKEAKEKTQRTD